MSRCVELFGGDLIIELDGQGRGRVLYSNLKDEDDVENESDRAGRDAYNAIVDGVESYVLALACAGVDVSRSVYSEALQTTLQAAAHETS